MTNDTSDSNEIPSFQRYSFERTGRLTGPSGSTSPAIRAEVRNILFPSNGWKFKNDKLKQILKKNKDRF